MAYRSVIALIGALPLSVGLCAAFAMLLPGGWRHSAIGVMVLAVPAWIGIACWMMAASTRRRLVARLVGGNAAAYALYLTACVVGPLS
jgi:hypothetical protein